MVDKNIALLIAFAFLGITMILCHLLIGRKAKRMQYQDCWHKESKWPRRIFRIFTIVLITFVSIAIGLLILWAIFEGQYWYSTNPD